jgi:archaellum component FlaC
MNTIDAIALAVLPALSVLACCSVYFGAYKDNLLKVYKKHKAGWEEALEAANKNIEDTVNDYNKLVVSYQEVKKAYEARDAHYIELHAEYAKVYALYESVINDISGEFTLEEQQESIH